MKKKFTTAFPSQNNVFKVNIAILFCKCTMNKFGNVTIFPSNIQIHINKKNEK